MKKVTCVAGIVLYNPEMERLKENIHAVYHQVDSLVLVDNASHNNTQIEELIKQYDRVFFIKNVKNEGIAKALNQLMEYANENSIEWVLTLDQDSVVPENLMEEYSALLESTGLALVTPNIDDRNFSSDENKNSGQEEVERCITSASLNNVEIWKKLGGFEERLFIDYVDFEYCAKVRKNGYKIIRVNDVKLLHEVGNAEVKHIFRKTFIVYNHRPIRKYYFFRNIIYCIEKYPEFFNGKQEKRNLKAMFLKSIIFEKYRGKKFFLMLKGIMDGKRMIKEEQEM